MNQTEIGYELLKLDGDLCDIIGMSAFLYSEWPTPTTGRYVFAHGAFPAVGVAGQVAYLASLLTLARVGAELSYPYRYVCLFCPEGFPTRAPRDEHQRTQHRGRPS
jgi:hypothetical protein